MILGDYSLEEAARIVSEKAIGAIDWRIHPQYHLSLDQLVEKAEYLKELCRRYSLQLPNLQAYVPPDDPSNIERLLRTAQVLDCPTVRTHPAPHYRMGEKKDYNQLLRKTREDLKIVQDLAQRYRTKVVLEIHSGLIIPTPGLAYRLVEGFDPRYIGIIYDVANTMIIREGRGGVPWKMDIDILGEYLSHVHVKLNTDRIDWSRVSELLRDAGYGGYVALEAIAIGENENRRDALDRNLEEFKRLGKPDEDSTGQSALEKGE